MKKTDILVLNWDALISNIINKEAELLKQIHRYARARACVLIDYILYRVIENTKFIFNQKIKNKKKLRPQW